MSAQITDFSHRQGLTDTIATLRPAPSLFERIGGASVVEAVIETLYEHLMTDPLLTPIFRRSFDRAHSKAFFTEWMGGPRVYSDNPVHARGVWRAHNRFFISRPMAGRWVYYMKNALKHHGIPMALRKEILGVLAPLARAMVNGDRVRPEDVRLHFKRHSIQSPAYWALDELRRAVDAGERQAVIDAVERDPSQAVRRGDQGCTLLWHAARAGDGELVAYLLDAGAPIDAPGCPPVCTDFIFESDGPASDPLVPISPYAIAAWHGHADVAAMLVERGAAVDWFDAAVLGDLDRLRAWAKQAPELIHAHDPGDDFFGVTALHHAITGGQLDAATWLVERGAEVREHSMWLLTLAALRERLALLELLLANGADARRALVFGPLDAAERPIADLLVASGADVNRHPAHGSLLVHVCRGRADGRLSRVRALLDYGADVRARGFLGTTALRLAVRARDVPLVELLLEAGAPVDTRDDHDETPLFGLQNARADGGAVDILRLFEAHGASLSSLNRWGETILFPLVRQGERDAVAWLLDHGSDADVVNERGKTVAQVARTSRRAAAAGIVELL